MLENVAFNAVEAFQQGQESHGPDILQKEFDINLLDFAETLQLFYFDVKKYIISMIAKLSKQR